MDDGMIIWRPTSGRRQQTKLESLATVLLAFKSTSNRLNSIVVGDNSGGIIHLSIPCLEVINRFELEGESIRSICSASESTQRLLVACQSGSIWMVGEQVPSRKVPLFQNDGPVTSIRVINNEIHCVVEISKFNTHWASSIRVCHHRVHFTIYHVEGWSVRWLRVPSLCIIVSVTASCK